MALVLNDGQLTTSSATLATASGSQYMAITLFNTSAVTTATLTLTLARSGGTARTFARAELGPYEALYVRGLPLDPTDTLAGSADVASVVDFLVVWDRDDSDFLIFTRAADGSPKASTTLTVDVPEVGIDPGQVEIIKRLDAMLEVLLEIR